MRLISVRTADDTELPWPKNSIYKYSSHNRFPEIIIKISGKLYVDLDAFEDLARKKRDAQIEKARRAGRGMTA